jgi:Phosphotransferase enzyme family
MGKFTVWTVESDIFLNRCAVSLFHSSSRSFVCPNISSRPLQRSTFRTAKKARRKNGVPNGTPSRARIHRARRDPQPQHATPESHVPIPKVFALCEDVDVSGTPFYITEFLDGRIFTDMSMPGVPPKVRSEWCVISFLFALPPRTTRPFLSPHRSISLINLNYISSQNIIAGSPRCAPSARSPLSTQKTSA